MTALYEYLKEERGRAVALARDAKVTPGAITQWAQKQVPAEQVYRVSELTGIPMKTLRPDMFEDAK